MPRSCVGCQAEQQKVRKLKRDLKKTQVLLRKSELDRKAAEARADKLEKQLEKARRAGKRQAAPFSKKHDQGDKEQEKKGKNKTSKRKRSKPGRKAGANYGKRYTRPQPDKTDEKYQAPLPGCCPGCESQSLQFKYHDYQYQIDIPPVTPIVREFEISVGCCTDCGRRVQGRHALQTSDALGAARVQMGPNVFAMAAFLNKELGASYEKIVRLYQTAFDLKVNRSTLCRGILQLNRLGQPTYQALLETIRKQPVVYMDETGWRLDGEKAWLWVITESRHTVFGIYQSRGRDVIIDMLGEDFDGMIGRDGWSAYGVLKDALHQSCLNHLLTRCHNMIEDSIGGQAHFPLQLKALLKAMLALRDRSEELSDHGFSVIRGKLEKQMDRLLETNFTHPPNARLAKHLRREHQALFTFLYAPQIEATNHLAEQAIRMGVINRKTCGGGNRSLQGSQAQSCLTSILATARRQDKNGVGLLIDLQRAKDPFILDLECTAQIH